MAPWFARAYQRKLFRSTVQTDLRVHVRLPLGRKLTE